MQWTKNTKLSALSSITHDSTEYTVHILEVSAGENLLDAFVEFWRAILTLAPQAWTEKWEILLFEMWTDSGSVAAMFTTKVRSYDYPVIFKLLSDEMMNEYDLLPSPLEDVGAFQNQHQEMLKRYRDMLKQAAMAPPIPELLQGIREKREVPIWSTYCNYEDQMHKLEI